MGLVGQEHNRLQVTVRIVGSCRFFSLGGQDHNLLFSPLPQVLVSQDIADTLLDCACCPRSSPGPLRARVGIRRTSGRPLQASDSSCDGVSSGYVTFLVVIVLSGWTLASYDFNLLIVAFPNIAKELHLTASVVARVLSAARSLCRRATARGSQGRSLGCRIRGRQGLRAEGGIGDAETHRDLASPVCRLLARLVRHALNRGNVLEGPLTDRIADAGNPGCQGQVATQLRRSPIAPARSLSLPIAAIRENAMEPLESTDPAVRTGCR